MMAKSIKGHTDFAVGFQQQDITFVYVKDVVAAVFLALTRGHRRTRLLPHRRGCVSERRVQRPHPRGSGPPVVDPHHGPHLGAAPGLWRGRVVWSGARAS